MPFLDFANRSLFQPLHCQTIEVMRMNLNAHLRGDAMFLRRHASPFPTIEVALKDIRPEATYEVSLSPGFAEAPRQRVSGKDLARLPVTIPDRPGSVLVRFREMAG